MNCKVTVWCTVYNHEKYLRKCLDGFVMQKTNFPFEVIVHDDCSTDSSKEIIQEYAKQYPDIICPVLENENQYSKGRINEIMMQYVRSKYFAICEGDDYWSSPYKLQKQFDYMEKDLSCVLCVHNTVIHDLSNRVKDKLFFEEKTIHELSAKEVFFGWNVHTSSYFIRASAFDLPKKFYNVWCGDYVMLTFLFTKGRVVSLPNVLSVYNYSNPDGVTMLNAGLYEREKAAQVKRMEYLRDLDEITDRRFHDIIDERIREILLVMKLNKCEISCTNMQYGAIKRIIKDIVNDEYYVIYKNKLSRKAKLKQWIKYEFSLGCLIYIVYKKYIVG